MQSDSENREGRLQSLQPLLQATRKYLTYAGNALQHRYLTLGTRIVLGGMFLVAGIAQLVQLDRFVSLAKQVNAIPFYTFTELYDITPSEQFITIGMLPDTLVRAYASYLPAVEVIIGITLLAGIFLRFSSAISILMLISFIVAKIIKTSHGFELPWGDFSPPEYIYGGISVWLIRLNMAVDFVLVAFALQIILHRVEILALGPKLRLRNIEKRPTGSTA